MKPIKRLFSIAFRPMFLGAFVYAPYVVALWVLQVQGILPFLSAQPLAWHAHEMMFGFVAAGIGGFLFTALANWTGRPPISGFPLALLFLSWLMGRVFMHLSGSLPWYWLGLIDQLYLAIAALLLARELVLAGNKRNYKVLGLITLFWLFNISYHLETASILPPGSWSQRGGLLTVILLISLIGGRIIPAFTRNWLTQRGVTKHAPAQTDRFDDLVMTLTIIALPAWVFLPDSPWTRVLITLAGIAHAVRLSRWSGLQIIAEPLLIVLHLGYLWLAVGLILLGVGRYIGIADSAGVHALMVGATATMLTGVGVRASLGHTGRALSATPLISIGFLCLSIAAICRIGHVMFGDLLIWATGFWILGFVLLLVSLAPIVLKDPA